jgi:phosphohistidine phosphatase
LATNSLSADVEPNPKEWYARTMERHLLVMRHCKSSWDHPGLSDHQRPLNKRGRTDAPKVGARLRALGLIPDRVVSSDSQRTQQSWAGVAQALEDPCEPHFTDALYHGDANDLRQIIEGQPASVSTLLVLGHNPGWEYFASWLAAERHSMTTGNVAIFRSTADSWALDPADWTLVDWIRPRDL